MNMKIRWLGNSCVEVTEERCILIDPNYIVEPDEEVDLVLVTHEHTDHIDKDKLNTLRYKKLIAPASTLELHNLKGIPAKVGEIIEGVEILESWCWKSQESVSYCYNGVLHAGDSAKFPDTKAEVVFTACFPDFYDEYVREMRRLSPKLVIPIHYSDEKRKHAEGLKRRMDEANIGCKLLKVGEEIKVKI